MGKEEEEIARIARRLDKMVTRKSAVRGAGCLPLRGVALGQMTPSPVQTPFPRLGLASSLSWDCCFALSPLFRRPAVSSGVLGPAVISPVCPTLQNQVSL